MLLKVRGQQYNITTVLWMIFLWFCIKMVNSDALPYGERIRPLKGSIRKTELVAHCVACSNRTSFEKNDEQSTKVEKKLEMNIKNKDGDKTNPSGLIQSTNPLDKTQQTASPTYSGLPKEKINNKGATFFFTQVEPHRYEYRAMFQHHRNNFQQTELFQPFVHSFEPFSRDYPPLPKFPAFPEFPQIFPDHKDPFPNFPDHKVPFPSFPDHKVPFPSILEHKDPFPNFPEFTFPTLSPVIKRIWEPQTEVKTQRPVLDENFNGPLVKNYDIVLGHNQYPKIFRFNEERINIEDFDREKKLKLYKLSKEGQNEITEPENVKRDHLLILHGGIFTVQEPPLFNKHLKKIRKSQISGAEVL